VIPVVTRLVRPTAAELADAAAVLDQYRRHYGEDVTAGQALPWLTEHASSGILTVFVAHIGGALAGIATTVAVPASLRLRCAWQLRDLYVVPEFRRRGTGRALVSAVSAAAAAAGAIRVSVQTEPDNSPALRLYAASGFSPAEDLHVLILELQGQ
jgi:GNAT superfamily N-acetyltransferase